MDYIEREAVEKMLENAQIISDGENCGYCTDDISISSIQSADVSPVVHGKIIETIKKGKFNRTFSCCGRDFTQLTMWYTPKYCPNCGAKMVGK